MPPEPSHWSFHRPPLERYLLRGGGGGGGGRRRGGSDRREEKGEEEKRNYDFYLKAISGFYGEL